MSSACSTSLRGAGFIGTLYSDEYSTGVTVAIRVVCANFSFELLQVASERSGNDGGIFHAIVGCT